MHAFPIVKHVLPALLVAILLGASSTALQAQTAPEPTAPPLGTKAQAAYERVRAGFCTSEKMLRCLEIDRPACEARVEGFLAGCRSRARPEVANGSDDDFLTGYFIGCSVGAAMTQSGRPAAVYACVTKRD